MMIFLPTELCVSCMILIPYSDDVVMKNPKWRPARTGQDRHDRPRHDDTPSTAYRGGPRQRLVEPIWYPLLHSATFRQYFSLTFRRTFYCILYTKTFVY